MAATKYIIYLSDTNNCISRKVGKKAEVISKNTKVPSHVGKTHRWETRTN